MTPALKWAFIISNNYSWFDSFVRSLSGTEVSILVDHEDDKPDAYLWSSMHLSELNDLQQVADRAAALKTIYDGAMYISYGEDYRPIEFLDLVNLTEEKRSRKLQGNFLASPFSSDCANWIFLNKAAYNPFGNFTSTMLFLARNDEKAKGMLQFLGVNGITWISLYALLDFMRQEWDIPKIALAAGSTKEEIKRFTGTANNYAAIGPFARHGEVGWQIPSKVMSLEESSKLILKATENYLIERCKTVHLKSKWEKVKSTP